LLRIFSERGKYIAVHSTSHKYEPTTKYTGAF